MRPLTTVTPFFSLSPESGSSIALFTHTGTPPTASAIFTVPSKENREA